MIRRLALAALVVAAAVPAGATDSRITALGEGSAFYEDDRGVMRWYSALADYPDLLVVQSGHFSADDGYKGPEDQRLSGPGAGAHLQLDEEGTWGTAAVYWHSRGTDADPGSLHRRYLGDHLTFMWAKDIDERISLGLVWRDAGETRTSYPEGDVIFGRQEVGFGMRYDMAERAYLDLSAEARRYTSRAEGTLDSGTSWKSPGDDSWDNFGFRGRVFWGISDRLVLVPLVEIVAEDYAATLVSEAGIDTYTFANQGDLWRLGCGLNFLRDPDNLIVLSADYIDGRMDHDVAPVVTADEIPYGQRYRAFLGKVAIESRLAHWITGRFSAGYEHLDSSGDFPYPESGSTLLISGGAGLHLADFVLDLALAGREPRGFSRYTPTPDEEESKLWMSATFRWDF